jgi:putative transposase
VKPEARKQAIDHMIIEHNLNQRTAFQLASVSRTGYRYQSKVRNDDVLRQRLKELATKQVGDGYLFVHKPLKNEGLVVNKKRTYRIYTERGL